jgi:hypothetical protein
VPAHALRLVAFCVLLASCGIAAADEPPGLIETDRPDLTNGVKTVPPGGVQIETGVAYARRRIAASEPERRLALEATLRVGLTDRLEVRLDGEPLVRLSGDQDDTGSGDVTVGLKYRFGDSREGEWFPGVGVQPFVKVPVAAAPIGSEKPDFGLIALASFDLPWDLGLDVNAGMAAIGQSRPDGYLLQALASASLGRAVTERLSMLVEVFFASADQRDARDKVGLTAGAVWRVARLVALDVAAVTSLAGPVPDYTLRAGVSLRFGG